VRRADDSRVGGDADTSRDRAFRAGAIHGVENRSKDANLIESIFETIQFVEGAIDKNGMSGGMNTSLTCHWQRRFWPCFLGCLYIQRQFLPSDPISLSYTHPPIRFISSQLPNVSRAML
jgi:hypothetical protein